MSGNTTSQNIQQLDPSLLSISLNSKVANKKSDEVLAASLHRLEELFEVVAKDEVSVKKPQVNVSLSTMESVRNEVRATLLKNPEAFEEVIALIAPHIQDVGEKVTDKLSKAREAFAQYNDAIRGVSKKTLKADFDRVLAPAFANEMKSRQALVGLYDSITPLLEKLNGKDPSRLQSFVDRLAPVLGMIALRNPEKAKEILGDFGAKLESAYDLDDSLQGAFFSKIGSSMRNTLTESEDPSVRKLLTRYSSLGTKNSPDMRNDLALAMLCLQQFQVALSKAQGNQGTIDATISNALVKNATSCQTDVDTQIDKQIKAAQEAAHRPWYEVFVQAFVTVVGVTVSALTAGAGAAVVAVAVGAFMATPAFNAAVQAIASVMPGPVGQIIGKVVVIAIVAAASFGAGGISVAGDSAVDTAATTGSKVSWTLAKSMSTGVKLAAFEGVSMLTSSGIAMDVMSLDSSFVKKHPQLAMWLNIAAEVVGMIATMVTGHFVFKGVGSGETSLEKLPSAFRGLIPLNWLGQMTQGGVEVGLGIERAGYLREAASATESLGAAQAGMSEYLSGLDMMSDTLKSTNATDSDITKAISDETEALVNASGSVWKASARVLSS